MPRLLRVRRDFMIKTDIGAVSNLLLFLIRGFQNETSFQKTIVSNDSFAMNTPPGYFLPSEFKSLTRDGKIVWDKIIIIVTKKWVARHLLALSCKQLSTLNRRLHQSHRHNLKKRRTSLERAFLTT